MIERQDPIDELHSMLEDAKIPHDMFKVPLKLDQDMIAYGSPSGDDGRAKWSRNQICYPNDAHRRLSVIQHFNSYGYGDKILEGWGVLCHNWHGDPQCISIQEAFDLISEDYSKNKETFS